MAAAPYLLESYTFDSASTQGMGNDLQRRDSGSVEFIAFVIALVGSALGILPGTRQQTIKATRLIVTPTRHSHPGRPAAASADLYSQETLSEVTPSPG